LKGKHTYDVLARAMESVYTVFDINDKIVYSTTDNGSNFVKSFKYDWIKFIYNLFIRTISYTVDNSLY